MPPQKNSGNRGSKRESGVSGKNRRFINDFLDDLRTEGNCKDVYIGRVTKKLGNGRVELIFYKKKSKPSSIENNPDDYNQVTDHALIRGSFRGKGKHSVWIDTASIVAIADTGIGLLEIMAVLTRDQLKDISKTTFIHPNILNEGTTSAKSGDITDTGFEFGNESSENEQDETAVTQKKDKKDHHVEKRVEVAETDDEVNVDDI